MTKIKFTAKQNLIENMVTLMDILQTLEAFESFSILKCINFGSEKNNTFAIAIKTTSNS